jgi:hypothetical protein
MYDATDNMPTADEIVAAVQTLQSDRDDLRRLLDECDSERDDLRRRLAGFEEEETAVLSMDLPSGREFVFIEDANVLAISPEMGPERRERLLAQLEDRPRLTTCPTCSAPLFEGRACRMH